MILKVHYKQQRSLVMTFKRGKWTGIMSVKLDENTLIEDLEHEDMYKYLGNDQCKGIQHAAMK